MRPVICFAILTLSITPAFGGYWVSEFRGSAEEYRLVRERQIVPLQQLMYLDTGDTIFIDDPEGQVLIVNDRDEQLTVTHKNAPFVVPDSASPPQLLINVRDWITGWWSTRDGQSTSTMAAISKGDLDPRITIATSGNNYLLEGTRELHVSWNGGIAPFDVTIIEESGAALGMLSGISANDATLPRMELVAGQYVLRVSAGDAQSSVILSVVGTESLPAPANAILTVDVPDRILFGHVAMVLSAYSDWRFEALQLAKEHDLEQIVVDLSSGNFPESDIREKAFMTGDTDSDP